jgi:hypothetical protein
MALPSNYKAIAAASPAPAPGNRELSFYIVLVLQHLGSFYAA